MFRNQPPSNPPRDIPRAPAEQNRQRHRDQPVSDRTTLRRPRDESLEPRFADVDVPGRDGQHVPVADQEGLGGEAADRHARRNVDAGAVEYAIADLYRIGLLVIETRPALEVDQPAGEAVLLILR